MHEHISQIVSPKTKAKHILFTSLENSKDNMYTVESILIICSKIFVDTFLMFFKKKKK